MSTMTVEQAKRVNPRRVLAIAAEVGADVIDSSLPGEANICLWAPRGVVWRATGTHSLTYHGWGPKREAWRALLEDAAAGVEPCESEACDTCAGSPR